jgi:phage-related tail protein
MKPETDAESNFSEAQQQVANQVSEVSKKAADSFSAAKEDLTQKAKDVAAESKDAFLDQAQLAQNTLTGAVAAFGGAVRAASEHLGNNDQRAASKFALEAAGGLERISASLKDKPFEEVLTEVRAFGANNPAALIGGAVFAGLALGRFIKSSSPDARTSSPDAASDGAVGRRAAP